MKGGGELEKSPERLLSCFILNETMKLEVTNPSELDIAKWKPNLLSQNESFSMELKILMNGKFVKNPSRIATYSPISSFIGHIWSTGRIGFLKETIHGTNRSS